MEQEKLNELIQLYFLGELDEKEKSDLEQLVGSSDEYKAEFESIKKLYQVFENHKPSESSEDSLILSRQELMRSIRKEQRKPNFFQRINEWIAEVQLSFYSLAAGSGAALVIGLVIGYYVFRPTLESTMLGSKNDVLSIDQVLSSGVNIGNVRLADTSPMEGKITITFEAAKPYTYTGNIEDKAAQQLMANLITKSDNPGLKIQTVQKLADNLDNSFLPDENVKKALMASLKNDRNAGVRRSALDVLKKYPYDDEIRDVILFTLSHDENSGIRVAAINALAELKLNGVNFDTKVKDELSNKVKNEQNLFIKNLAESLLKGDDL